MVIFLYCYDDLNYFHAFLRASVIMGLLGLAAFAAIVVPFAISAARPVEEAQERQRRFVTDASHELRTPISIIGSATDVIEIESGESEWTQSIHNQTRRLEDLTNKLVALAKADEGAVRSPWPIWTSRPSRWAWRRTSSPSRRLRASP